MKNQDLQAEINAIDQESAQLESGVEQSVIKKLLNNVERLASENEALKIEVQNLKDENNRLKGEQGKPDIKANKKKDGDISSETERKQAEANGEGVGDANGKKKRQRKPKLPKLKIDREQICVLDKSGLPDDLIFKGHADIIVQNIIIKTDNVRYRREVYYSPSQHKNYCGELPDDVRGKGEYGSGIRTLIPVLKAECNISEKRILGFFCNFGIQASATYLSQQWTGGYELFHPEKSDLYRNGIAHSDYIQIDDTSARVNGLTRIARLCVAPYSQPTSQPRRKIA